MFGFFVGYFYVVLDQCGDQVGVYGWWFDGFEVGVVVYLIGNMGVIDGDLIYIVVFYVINECGVVQYLLSWLGVDVGSYYIEDFGDYQLQYNIFGYVV